MRAFLDALAVYPANASKKAEFRGLTPKEVLAKSQSGGHRPCWNAPRKSAAMAAFFNAQADEALIQSPAQGHHESLQSQTDAPTANPSRRKSWPRSSMPRHSRCGPANTRTAGLAPCWAYAGARVNGGPALCGRRCRGGGHWGIHIRALRPDQRLKNVPRFVPLSDKVLQAGFLAFVEDVKRRVRPPVPAPPAFGSRRLRGHDGDQFRAYAIKRGLTGRLKSFHCFRHNVANTLVNELGTAIQVTQETGHDLTLPSGLKHYVNPGTIPKRFAALNEYGPPVPLPAYVPGQFDLAFKQVRHMQRRRERASSKALESCRGN